MKGESRSSSAYREEQEQVHCRGVRTPTTAKFCLEPDAENEGEDSLPLQGPNAEGLIALRGGTLSPPPAGTQCLAEGGGGRPPPPAPHFEVTNN